MLWEAKPSKSVNFVAETSVGVFAGNDEGSVVLLNKSDRSTVWKLFVEKTEIKSFHGETDDGFLLSNGDQVYWLVDKAGKLVLRCGDQCIPK